MIKTACSYCGTNFTIQPSILAIGGGQYCSQECGRRARKNIPLESGYIPNSRKRTCTCQNCGEEFQLAVSKITDGRGRYCSQDCRQARYIRQCQYCGQEFQVKKSSRKKYCSIKCAGKAKRVSLTECICMHCGKKFMTHPTKRTPFCSRGCSRISWNDYFFDVPSADGAYIIGFIVADGSIRKNEISIGQKGKDILFKIAEKLEYDGELGCNNTGVSVLRLYSPHAYEILTTKYDMPFKDKTYCVQIPSIIENDDKLLPHFIRGLWDGDGHIGQGGSSGFTSGSLELIRGLGGVLKDKLGIAPSKGIKRRITNKEKTDGTMGGGWEMCYNILETIALAKYLYGPNLDAYSSNLYLERKRKRFCAKIAPFRDYEWMKTRFIDEEKTVDDIAKLLDVKRYYITTYLDKFGLKPKPCQFYQDFNWMKQKFVDEKKFPTEIAEEAGTRKRTILKHLYKMGLIKTPPPPKRKLHRRGIQKLNCLNEVLFLRQEGLSFAAIGQRVQDWGELTDLKPRSIEQALRRYFAQIDQ